MTQGFVPPPYPYDRLDKFKSLAEKFDGGLVDLSIGTPCDAPSPAVVAALSASNSERGYPPSIGTEALRNAAQSWMQHKFEVSIPTSQIAACIGSKEFVATTPQYMKLRSPDRDTVLFPAVSYPTYEMGAILAGCRPVAVPMTPTGGLDFAKISANDISRALMIWSNSPNNPTGDLDDLKSIAEWGRKNNVPVFSDECYVEFTWSRQPESILQHGVDGVIALHSLSKRSNLAGLRVGFMAGDPDLVSYLGEVRRHAGLMVAAPNQAAAAAALADDAHVDEQRSRYQHRRAVMTPALESFGLVSDGGPSTFYLWLTDSADPSTNGWAIAERLARTGLLVAPGDLYGAAGAKHVRLALSITDEQTELAASRLRQ